MTSISRRRLLGGMAAAGAAASAPWLFSSAAQAQAGPPLSLSAQTRIIEVNGKAATVFGLLQTDGTHGLATEAGSQFNLRLHNRLAEETVIHWHGLTPPWKQDGVGGVSQSNIAPGAFHDYDFPLEKPGTFWMHSHSGLQEQRLLAAPLIVKDRAEKAEDIQEIVVIFHDFTFRSPEEILAGLSKGGHGTMAGMSGMDMGGMNHAMPMKDAMGNMDMMMQPHLQDIEYDALLANDRTLDDPAVFRVERKGRIRLRLINGATATNMWIDLGALSGTLIAVDGQPVQPIMRSRFEFSMAQRLDIMLQLPSDKNAWPIYAVQEGSRKRTGFVLAPPDAAVEKLSNVADKDFPAVGLELEAVLHAVKPLSARAADRRHTMMLGEEPGYVWTLDGATHGKDTPLLVKKGERFELTFMNHTSMAHPMHLHGHHFQVVAINSKKIAGAVRDTVLVPAHMGRVTIAFDADNAGDWPLHCHHLYHMAAGMMTTLHYG